ncbi:MAG: GAF and ANTAR domain-containing protein [Acidimicrobiales bacterium]
MAVHLPDELARRLAAVAQRQGRGIDEVASEILAAGLPPDGHGPPRQNVGIVGAVTPQAGESGAGAEGLGLVEAALKCIESGDASWDRVCAACAEALAVSGAGIILLAGGDHRQSLGMSDEVEGVIEELQFTLGEGPCVDAARSAAPVHAPDLGGAGQTRWPTFSAQAVDAGVAAIFALPLQVGSARVGAMNLYRDRPGPLSYRQLATALAMADLVTHTILALQANAPAEALAAGLADVPFRAQVHQATGRISAQLGVAVAEALVRLRAFAYSNDRPIDEVAGLVVAGTLRFDEQAD